MTTPNPEIDLFISKAKQWQEETQELRSILLECGLTETLKWRQPCYTYEGSNIVIIGGFKAYSALGFFKGVLLKDTQGVLSSPGEHSQSVKQMRFTSVEEIASMRAVIKEYVLEAIEVERSGVKIPLRKSTDLELTQELLDIFEEYPEFKAAFEALTPGRQRAYHLFFSAAKQPQTRISRVGKYMDQIMDGKGINDCTCGLTKKPPGCDGSHKFMK